MEADQENIDSTPMESERDSECETEDYSMFDMPEAQEVLTEEQVWLEAMTGLLVDGPFSCGGSACMQDTITIAFKKCGNDSSYHSLSLPSSELSDLLEAMEHAIPGHGQNLGSTLKLDLDHFLTNFERTKVFAEIIESAQKILGLEGCFVELREMNAYRQGGFFKPQVDEVSPQCFMGKIVVVLPCSHTGGELVVSQRSSHTGGQLVAGYRGDKPSVYCCHDSDTHDSDGNGLSKIMWAAFSSSCVYEVREVISGVALTFTYNMYVKKEPSLGEMFDVKTCKFYKMFHRMVKCDDFFPQGSILGFPCQGSYPFPFVKGDNDERVRDSEGMALLLKGSDAELYASALALGLKTEVKPVLGKQIYDERSMKVALGYKFGPMNLTHSRDHDSDADDNNDSDAESDADDNNDNKVIWCDPNAFRWNIESAYGDAAHHTSFSYGSVAIIVKVPSWEERTKDANDIVEEEILVDNEEPPVEDIEKEKCESVIGNIFPIGKTSLQLKKVAKYRMGSMARVNAGAPVYLTSVVEYLCAEILDLAAHEASTEARNMGRNDPRDLRILPKHVSQAIGNDSELKELCEGLPSMGSVVKAMTPFAMY